MQEKRVSLRTLASECGISYQTVSRIMNGQADMHRPGTVKKVEDAARRLGYRRNLLARGMLTGRSLTIGVILPYYLSREFNNSILEGIQKELSHHDYVPVILSVTGDEDEDMRQSHRLIERRVDGVIFRMHPFGESETYLKELARHNIPLVAVVDSVDGLLGQTDFVGVDERAHGEWLAQYLLELGHRHVGFTRTGSEPFDLPLNLRLNRFTEVFKRSGGRVTATPQQSKPELDEALVKNLLTMEDRPTAVVCSVDDLAYQVINLAFDLGLRVPQDLSVVGSCNYSCSRFFRPALTSVDLNPEEIGRQSAELLIKRITDKKKTFAKVFINPSIVKRDSCGTLAPKQKVIATER